MHAAPTCRDERYMRWIAILNLGKGLLLCSLALGMLGFLHKDVDVIVGNWISLMGLNMENRHIVRLLARLDQVTDHDLAQWSKITFAFAGVFLTQGTGLIFKQDWARYLTIFMTASFIPLELKETVHHFGYIKLALLAINVGVVSFLIISLQCEKRRAKALLKASEPVITRPAVVECEPV